eukprot:Em0005g881a
MEGIVLIVVAWLLSAGACPIQINVDRSDDGTNCSQALSTPALSQTVCNDLEPILLYVESLGITTGPSNSCIQVNIAPGSYVITKALRIQQSLTLSGTEPGVILTFNMTADQSSPYYAVTFADVYSVTLSNLSFSGSPGLLGFENVTVVSITSCSFSYFLQGAVDIYNCGYPTIVNCTFAHNGPTYILKRQRYRGHSGGLSIGFNYDSVIGYNPQVLVSNCTFVNNSVQTRVTTATQVLQNRIFTGRGGGASIIINAADSVGAVVEDCYFTQNGASTLGGGLYTIPDGLSNHTIIVNRTKFVNNWSDGGGGGLQQVYINPGSLSRLLSVLTYNCDFIGNSATIGGGVYQFLTGYVPIIGEVGNYAHFENCYFQGNRATRFGAAIAMSSGLLFGNRERIRSTDVINCTFTRNTALNKAGVVSMAYFSMVLSGLNQFLGNVGSALTVVGSVVHLNENGVVQIFNSTNAVDGSAMSFISLGQAVLYTNSNVNFLGNVGSLGASIALEDLRYLPTAFQQVLFNPICIFRHIHLRESPLNWEFENIKIVFDSNTASVGAAIYTSNAAVCSWLRLNEPFFNTSEFYRIPVLSYKNNRNIGHFPQDYETKWDVQTKPVALNIEGEPQMIEAFPGQLFTLQVTASDEFNFSTVSVVELTDSGVKGNSSTSEFSFSQSATVIDNLTAASFQTSYYTLSNMPSDEEFEVETLFTTIQYSTKFTISSLPCPTGTILAKQDSSYYTCQCNLKNPIITECRNFNIVLKTGYWASESNSINSYGDSLQAYTCPAAYCRCQLNSRLCESVVNFKDADAQCSCLRSGVLCGDCVEGHGVSVLRNRCVTCSDASGVLIALLIFTGSLVFLSLMVLSVEFPSWLLPCSFYLQLLPFVTEHFTVTFETIRPYLYYVSSGLSFYFVYDFCLYSNMSPLVSYFIRYLPLFTAIITCSITVAIMYRCSPRRKWHGLWWIAVLIYTHVVHTSMSILNCPRLPGSDGNSMNVWYVNGNIKCFSGGHTPLAILAILVLTLSLACIPLVLQITRTSKFPVWIQKTAYCLIPALVAGYKDEVKWFGSVELFRRLITTLFIVALPGNEYSSIFLIIIIITIYGYVQPYKLAISNILEILIAVDVLILLFVKNTNQIRDTFETAPAQPTQFENANTSAKCTDNDNIEGLSPLVKGLTVLYYLPLLIIVVGGISWTVYKLHFGLFRKKKEYYKHSKTIENSLLEHVPDDGSVRISMTAFYELNEFNRDLADFTTPYMPPAYSIKS